MWFKGFRGLSMTRNRVTPCGSGGSNPSLSVVFTVVKRLGPGEVAVLTLIAERLLLGRRRYGDLHLATDRRDVGRPYEPHRCAPAGGGPAAVAQSVADRAIAQEAPSLELSSRNRVSAALHG